MPSSEKHALTGFLLAIALGYAALIYIGLNWRTCLLAGLFLLLGSVIPDVYHRRSRARRALPLLYFTVLALSIALIFYLWWPNWGLVIACSLLVAMVLVVADITVFRMRYTTHSFLFALLYALICYIVADLLPGVHAFVAAGFGFIGYLSHIVVDAIWLKLKRVFR